MVRAIPRRGCPTSSSNDSGNPTIPESGWPMSTPSPFVRVSRSPSVLLVVVGAGDPTKLLC